MPIRKKDRSIYIASAYGATWIFYDQQANRCNRAPHGRLTVVQVRVSIDFLQSLTSMVTLMPPLLPPH